MVGSVFLFSSNTQLLLVSDLRKPFYFIIAITRIVRSCLIGRRLSVLVKAR